MWGKVETKDLRIKLQVGDVIWVWGVHYQIEVTAINNRTYGNGIIGKKIVPAHDAVNKNLPDIIWNDITKVGFYQGVGKGYRWYTVEKSDTPDHVVTMVGVCDGGVEVKKQILTSNKTVDMTGPDKTKSIYLAGDMTPHWRNEVVKAFEKNGLLGEYKLIDPIKEEGSSSMGDYVRNDLGYVKNCDILFVYVKKDSPSAYLGTMAEMTWAYANKKLVIMVNEKVDIHPFMCYFSKLIRTELQAGIRLLVSYCKNDDSKDYAK